MNLPFQIDLNDKVVVITGAGGVICSEFALAVAKTGAKVALLDIQEESAKKIADDINTEGGKAIAYKCNVLDRPMIESVQKQIHQDLGTCDILINGAGGNNPKATSDDEYYDPKNTESIKTFFDLDQAGIEFVFNLNYMGALLPTQVFAKDMIVKN